MIDGKQGIARNKIEGGLGVVTERGKELHDSAHRSSPPKASQFPYSVLRTSDSILYIVLRSYFLFVLEGIGEVLMKIKYISRICCTWYKEQSTSTPSTFVPGWTKLRSPSTFGKLKRSSFIPLLLFAISSSQSSVKPP
jgi:hypothetical protein